ncbi:MAG: hypothetical protein CR968_00580 [Flavobacteriia bacterium]|nr:MAG: hypothetical protein CR968_00580 [Flavobacteriia bacterium]
MIKVLNREKYHQILAQYLPEKALDYVVSLLEQHPVHLKITRERSTKHGDFRSGLGRQPMISINHNLNPYAFLITLLHEIAHYKVYKKYIRRRKPHGKEWKTMFRDLMTPMLDQRIFPETLHNIMVEHMKNPKASSSSDPTLAKALKQYDTPNGTQLLNDLKTDDYFEFKGKVFKLGSKKRTRYMCHEVKTNRDYLINQLAEVHKIN